MDVQELARLILAGGAKKFNKTNDTLGNVLSRIGEAGTNYAIKRINDGAESARRMARGETNDDDLFAIGGMTGPINGFTKIVTGPVSKTSKTPYVLEEGGKVYSSIRQAIKAAKMKPQAEGEVFMPRSLPKSQIDILKQRFTELQKHGADTTNVEKAITKLQQQAGKVLPPNASKTQALIDRTPNKAPGEAEKAYKDFITIPSRVSKPFEMTPEKKSFYERVDAMRKAANPKPTSTSSNLYHTTKAENLDSIAREGLVTGKAPRYEGVSSTNKISFGASEKIASYYGAADDVMIRTKKGYIPENLDSDLLAGGANQGSYTTTKNIPPEYLEVKIKGKWIPLEEYANPLTQEARKYKSAEEFVNRSPNIQFHGSPTKLKGSIRPSEDGLMGSGLYVAPTEDIAAYFGKAEGVAGVGKHTNEAIKPTITSFDVSKLKMKELTNKDEYFNFVDDTLGRKRGTGDLTKELLEKVNSKLKAEGYDGITLSRRGESVVFPESINKVSVKTKSQLTDIWQKANKK